MKSNFTLFKDNPKTPRMSLDSDLYSIAKHDILENLTENNLTMDIANQTSLRFYDCPAGGTFPPNEKFTIRETVRDVNRYTRILHKVCQRYAELQPNLPSYFLYDPHLMPDQTTIDEVMNMYERMKDSTHSLTIEDDRARHDCKRFGAQRYYLTTAITIDIRKEYARRFNICTEPVVCGPLTLDAFIASMRRPEMPKTMGMGLGGFGDEFIVSDPDQGWDFYDEYTDAFLPPENEIRIKDRLCTNFSPYPKEDEGACYFGSSIRIGDNILAAVLTPQQRASYMFDHIYRNTFSDSHSGTYNVKLLFDDLINIAEHYFTIS